MKFQVLLWLGTLVLCGRAHAALPAHVSVYTGIDPAAITNDADLAPIDGIIGGALSVALGESVHTSGGYHEVKFRVIRHLIEQKGFRVLVMETPFLQASTTSEYFATCAGGVPADPAALSNAVGSIFAVFQSTTVRDMFSWICQFNAQHPNDPVLFFGFDMQEPAQQVDWLKTFFQLHTGADTIAANLTAIETCDGVTSEPGTNPITQAQRAACEAAVGQLEQTVKTGGLKPAPTLMQTQLAAMILSGLRAMEEEDFLAQTQSTMPGSFQARDQAMAENILALRRLWFPSKRAVIWAHDIHVERDGQADAMPAVASIGSYKNMGQYLADNLKSDYVSFGLFSYQTDINWPLGTGQPNCQSDFIPAVAGSIETVLHGLGQPFLIVNTTAMRKDSAALFKPGAVFIDGAGSQAAIDAEFDGLIYMDHSPAMDSVLWGACPAVPST